MRTLRTIIKTIIVVVIIVIAAGLIYMYSGAYNVGQDVPHNAATKWLLNTARERSIENHDSNVKPPALDKPDMVTAGAKIYATHCSGCHLAPGKDHSAIRDALYPRPPDLGRHKHINPAEAFWVVKHGIKFTAMPAWGTSLNDTQIWQLVAFLKEQPVLTPAAYKAMAAPKQIAPATQPASAGSAPAAAASTAAMPGAAPGSAASTVNNP